MNKLDTPIKTNCKIAKLQNIKLQKYSHISVIFHNLRGKKRREIHCFFGSQCNVLYSIPIRIIKAETLTLGILKATFVSLNIGRKY